MGKKKLEADDILGLCGGYTSVKVLGKGSYGEVREVIRNGVTLAAKISIPVKIWPYKFMGSDIVKEIDLLTRLRHPNVVSAVDGPYLSTVRVCVFMDLLPMDLYKAMKQKIPLPKKLDWADKLWSGLAYLHANFVVHCDIKPANITVNPDTSEIKIIDYGMAVNLPASRRVKFSTDIVSAWWRPPEIFGMEESIFETVGPSEYYFGTEVDVYSMGWVVLELIGGIEPPKLLDAKQFDLYFWYLAAIGLDPGPDFIVNNPPRKFRQKANGVNIVLGTINKNYLTKVISTKAPKSTVNYLSLVSRAVISPPLERPKASDFLVNPDPPVISYPRVDVRYRGNYSKECRSKAIKLLQAQLASYLPKIGILNANSVLLEAIDLMDRIFSVKEFSNDNFVVGVATTLSLTLTMYTWDGDAYHNSIMEILNFDQRKIFFQTYSEIILALNGRLFRPTLDFGGEISTQDALKIFKGKLSPSDIKPYLNST